MQTNDYTGTYSERERRSFIENQPKWHGIAPKKDELEKALKELDEKD